VAREGEIVLAGVTERRLYKKAQKRKTQEKKRENGGGVTQKKTKTDQ